MSSKTKIIVLKSKELIYTGIFIVLGILLILLLWYMFSPKEDERIPQIQASQRKHLPHTSQVSIPRS